MWHECFFFSQPGLTTLGENRVTWPLLADLRAKWMKICDTSEKLAYILMFLSPLLHVPLPFTKQTCCTMILKKIKWPSLASNIWNQIRNMGELLVHEYWGKKVLLAKNTIKILTGGNRVISLTPGWKDHPLDLVWWAQTTDGCMSSFFLLVHTNIYRIKQICWRI